MRARSAFIEKRNIARATSVKSYLGVAEGIVGCDRAPLKCSASLDARLSDT
jgi:hypothetical protein